MINAGAGELIHIRGNSVVQDLDLVRHGYRTVETDPSYAYLAPDGESLALFRDVRRTAEDIARFSKPDGAAYIEFMRLIDALMDMAMPMLHVDPAKPPLGHLLRTIGASLKHRKLRGQLSAFAASSPDQIACERFEHPYTRALLLGIVAAGPVDIDGHGIGYLLVGLLHRIGVCKPIGGMQTFIDALVSRYKAAGGALLLNAPVAEIRIADGRATGVRLVNGRTLSARAIVATCDPRIAFKLATSGAIDRTLMQRMEHAPAYRMNSGPSLLNVAMAKQLALKRHQDLRRDGADLNSAVALIGDADRVRDSFAASRRGEIPERHCFSVSPTTNWDPTQAPTGQSAASLYLPATPVDARGAWAGGRQPLMDRVLREAGDYYDGFDAELGRWFETSPERALRANVTNGCVVHVDFGPYRSGLMRPAPGLATPHAAARGLFLGGAGTHPGGGVSGSPGKIAAGRVNAFLKKG